MKTADSRTPSAFLCFGLAAVAAWLCGLAWRAGQAGSDAAALGAAALALLACQQILSGFAAWHRYAHQRRIEKRASRPGSGHGAARWATLKDLRRAGMRRDSGLYLGQLKGRDLFYPGETSLLTIAPPGAGKGVCIVVQTLLRAKHSMIVTDPKGELYAITAKYRKNVLGHRIIVLCPWAEKMSAELGIPIPDHGFNPLFIIKDGPDAKDDAELIASLLLPGKARMNASDEFWLDGGQTLLSAFILYLKWRFGTIDLPLLRRYLLAGPEVLFETLCDMAACEAFGGSVKEYGGKLLTTLKNAPQQFEGALGSAQKALRIYDQAGPLAAHVSHGEIDFAGFKEAPTTLYLIMPSERSVTHAAWLNLVISLAFELVGRDRSTRRVTFLLDEFCNLGYLPNVLRAMALYRSQGVQAWLICQQISQLDRLYGIEGRREILGMAELVNTFGAWEPETIKLLSEWLGTATGRQFSENITPQWERGDFAHNYNASDHSTPLLRPEDIRTLPTDEQLIFYRNLPPIRARTVSYLKDRAMRRRAQPNPYHRKS